MTNNEINASARGFERRLHNREQVLLSCVRLPDDNGGIVLNVCERGLALRAARPLVDDQFTQVRFQLSQADDWIETKARVAWISAPKTTAGIEFVGLSTEARSKLAQWISLIANASLAAGRERAFANITVAQSSVSSVDATNAVSIAKPEKGEDLVELSQDSNIPNATFVTGSTDFRTDLGPEQFKEYERGTKLPELRGFHQEKVTPTVVTYRRNRFRLPTILFVTSAVLAVGFFGMAQFLRNERAGVKETGSTSWKTTSANRATLPSGGTSSAVSATVAVPQELSSLSAASQSAPGFVLQAGTMRREENAYALASALQQRKFPAFAFRGKAGRLYEVFVGPYADPKVAAKTKKELQDQGFATIVRQWPLQQ